MGDITLTRGQRQVLELAARGWTMDEIADELGISAKAVDGCYGRIRARLQARNNVEMVAQAIVLGLIDPPPVTAEREAA